MTTTNQQTDLRYPIGRFDFDAPISESDYPRLIAAIAETPGALRAAVAGLSRDQLETPYRPGGWTVKQVAHHMPDSHMNAYTRFKLALTEDEPTIKPYDEAAWAELADSQKVPIDVSLDLLDALARAVGGTSAINGRGRLRPWIPPPGTRAGAQPEAAAWIVRVARTPSCRAHYFVEKAGRLVTELAAPRLPHLST